MKFQKPKEYLRSLETLKNFREVQAIHGIPGKFDEVASSSENLQKFGKVLGNMGNFQKAWGTFEKFEEFSRCSENFREMRNFQKVRRSSRKYAEVTIWVL